MAIFYSFIANDSISKNLGGVSEAVKQIDSLSNNIENSIVSIEQTKKSSEAIKENISNLVVDLNSKINSLEESVSDVKTFRDLLNNSINEGFKNVSNDISSLKSVKIQSSSKDNSEFSLENSFLFLQAIFLITYAFEKNKRFLFHRIFNTEAESYYIQGVIGSLNFSKYLIVDYYDNDSKSMTDWYFVFGKINFNYEDISNILNKKIEESDSKELWRAELDEAMKRVDEFPQKK